MRRLIITLSLAIVALTFALTGTSLAQYAPPIGNVTLTVDSTTPGTGSDTNVVATVLDSAGVPVVGQVCTFSIQSLPGNDAVVGAQGTTDSQGHVSANLYTGSEPGVIVVKTICGDLTSEVLAEVSSAAPPRSPIQPPSTGDAGLADPGH